MSEVHNHVESNTFPFILRRQLVDCTCSGGGRFIPVECLIHYHPREKRTLGTAYGHGRICTKELMFIDVPRNVDPYYYVSPRVSFEPLGRYYLGEWSENDNESRLRMRPDAVVWPSPTYLSPYFAPLPTYLNRNSVDRYYDVQPPNVFAPLSRYYPGEWMDVEHLSCFARRPEEELHWILPPCLPPPIASPIYSGIIVEDSDDDDVILIQPHPNWIPNRNPKGLHGFPVDHHVCSCCTILPTPHRYAPWMPDDSTIEELYSTMHCCDFCE